ncbi:PilN domain-containing protein [Methylolobus aquaticus]|uniref:PilN domain-containing protein n=1 Tax=Methylotetracoccus oryzae TaxID=1919059 RepID=UPI001913D400|nr:PilN domain-containing protein [Methylotetracoccus oryzae]
MTVHINLLPWRAELRQQKKRDFFARVALAVFCTLLVMLSVHLHIARTIDRQVRRNEFMKSEIRVLDEKIKEIQNLDTQKRRLVARMEVIQQLQTSRPAVVHLFDEIVQTVPEGVSLSDLTQTDQKMVINGSAQSNGRVSAYLRNLESSRWLTRPILNVIQTEKEKDTKTPLAKQFTVRVEQISTVPEGTPR